MLVMVLEEVMQYVQKIKMRKL